MLYELFTGYQPFNDQTSNEDILFEMIKTHTVEYHEVWEDRSKEAKDLVRHLLERDPEKRYNMTQIKESDWYQRF